MDAVALHSGKYVEKFKASPTFRVSRLVPRIGITANDRVLDVGCGLGTLADKLEEFKTYDGVDFSPDFIAAASEKANGKTRFHCADIVDFCAEHPASFDVATTLDFSEHIDDDTFRSIYSAIHSALREGGRLYLHTPNLDFLLERAKDVGIVRQFPEHIAVRTGEQNAALLRECGFSQVNVEVIPHYNVLKHIHPLSGLPVVGKLFGARLWIEAKA